MHEIAEVEGDAEALRFALGCAWVAIVQRAGFARCLAQAILARWSASIFERRIRMSDEHLSSLLKNPRSLGVACAVAATGLGLAHLAAAGAPGRYLAINAAALLLGLVAFSGIAKSPWNSDRAPGGLVLALSFVLIATALFGVSVDGASRWVQVGPLGVQMSLVVLPAMIVVFAFRRDAIGSIGMILAAAALALQPDRGMAGALALSLAALALVKPGRWVAASSIAAIVAFGVTLLRPDTLPARAHVDQILYSAFETHALAGAAVLTGALLLIAPALAGLARGGDRMAVHVAFGTAWLGIVAAAALGNYPTPVVGYGGSAVLGYLLSLAFLPRAARSEARVEDAKSGEPLAKDVHGSHMSLGLGIG